MEFNINILDSFPSLNKISQKNNLLLEFNNKEYFLNKLIFQQEVIVAKKSLKKFYFKIFLLSDTKKILIGSNYINQDLSKSDNNKSFISWLEFRKNNQCKNNNKELNDDINFLFFDCIRLKIKITLVKTIPKTDKRIKTTKSKIKEDAKTPNLPKKQEFKFKDINNLIELNHENSFENIENNNYLLKSQSQDQNLKLNGEEEIKIKNTFMNNIKENHNNLRIKSEDIISNEFKNLFIDNDCLLTDNNLLENYSYSTSLGDNNNKNNIIKNKIELESKIIIDNKNDNINSDLGKKNNLIALNNFNYSNNKQEKYKNKINNKQINTEYNNENNKNKKINIMKSKFKRINKLIKENKNHKEKKCLKIKSNLMNKKNNNTNKTQSLIKDQIYFNSNTYNNFYKKKQINEENKIHIETNLNHEENKNIILNNLLIQNDKEKNKSKTDLEKTINHSEYEEFISAKKDYDLLYTSPFIKEIKKDLLDLEFNIALEKSISLFLSYNNQIHSFFKQKNKLFDEIKAYEDKIKYMNKKLYLLNSFKANYEFKEKNKVRINEYDNINLKENYLKQKNIFENLINDNINKKIILKSIISILLKKKPGILENIKNSNKLEKENINSNEIKNDNKLVVKSPSRATNKMKINSPQVVKQKRQYEFMSEIKNDNSKFNNKLNNKKKTNNKNLRKNRSINYIVSVGNIIEKNNNKNKINENKANLDNDNLIYYSTAKNKFYNPKNEKGK